jgi:hypothetical protein
MTQPKTPETLKEIQPVLKTYERPSAITDERPSAIREIQPVLKTYERPSAITDDPLEEV